MGRIAHRASCLVVLLVDLHTLVRPRQQGRAILSCQRPSPEVVIVWVIPMVLAELGGPKCHHAPVHHRMHHGLPPTVGPIEAIFNGLPLWTVLDHALMGPATIPGL